ncbi:hypothetical protein OG21DRAFT_1479725 [Imleria badia]|nr:hypothetical protein OG21DRAFT_1479725 [Imleria badia]
MAMGTARPTSTSGPREETAHDDLGHKGVFTVRTRLLLRFWWPMLVDNVKWFIRTCHKCQIHQTQCFHIPPTVPTIGRLFRKVHIDTMLMPQSSGYQYIVQARPAFVQALDVLADRYNIHHIHISPYNFQANGVVEQRHYDVREAISCWYSVTHLVFWAKCVTILRSTGLSPYFMIHGVEPLFPFDFSEATFLVPPPDTNPISLSDLIAWRAQQLQKHQEDLKSIREHVLKAHFESVKHFEATFKNQIKDFNFRHGSLVLVRNTHIKKELNRKMKPRYLGLMVVLCRTTGGSYILAELDGMVSKLCYAAFRLLPYYPHFQTDIPVTELTGLDDEDLDKLAGADIEEPDDKDLE